MPLATKELQADYMKEWRVENKDKVKANFQKWKEENKESRTAYMKEYMDKYCVTEEAKSATFVRNLWRNYRLSPDQFNAMWEAQDGKCGICQCAMVPRGREQHAVSVDHNHQTGEIRGLLCQACNRGIGNLKDCPAVLEAAAKYLREKGNYGTSPLLKELHNGN